MPALKDQDLYQALKELAVINTDQLDQAFETAKETKLPFSQVLLDKDLISDQNLGTVIADLTGSPFIRLSTVTIPPDILQIVPEVVAKSQKIIAFKKDPKGLYIATSDPANLQIIDFFKKKTGLPVLVYYATDYDLENAYSLYSKDVTEAFDEIISQNIAQAKGATKAEPPIIKIVDTILDYAYQNKSSDIHIEPLEKFSLVRFRIDGILHDIVKLPIDLHQRIVTRIKVLSKLRTDIHQAAQDGKLKHKTEREDVDVRVSIIPIINGEKIVMRLLSERSRQFSLTDLGLVDRDLVKVKASYQKPYGMLLSTGPTGSGKTTTLYAILKLLNRREVNIATIEDPVEYDIEGINQIQVNPQTNLTFADGLKSILRQDPNIILVGEIRDEDTANIATNAAMTGHLVLSTLHTNDATTSIPRLFDMGIEPYLVASTVNVIVAQRLIRKIHTVCRASIEVDLDLIRKQLGETIVKEAFPGNPKSARIYTGKGCHLCHDTGYEGRVGIFEVLQIDDEMRQAIIDQKDAATLRKLAIKNGMTTMLQDGLNKVKQGITTIDEILRVTKE